MVSNNDDNENRQLVRKLGVFMTIPFVLAVPPIVGMYLGKWLDKQFGTDPIFMFVFLIFGVAAGFREFYRIIKRFGNGN